LKTIYIIDEQDSYREGLKHLLQIKLPDIEIKTFSLKDKRKLFNSLELPDLVIIDPCYGNSLDIINYFAEKNVKISLLTLTYDKCLIEFLIDKEISGFLIKGMETKEFIKSIINILAGRMYIHHEVAHVLIRVLKEMLPKKVLT
jgi:DNA-binding NarL/FixJ family response regulator